MAAHTALIELKLNLDELVRQRQDWRDRWEQAVHERHDWETRYLAVLAERDTARSERDTARTEANRNMSP